MILDQILLPHVWRRYFAIARILLGLACLGLVFSHLTDWPPLVTALLVALFLVALCLPWQRRAEEIWGGRLILALDAAFFISGISFQREGAFWFGACFAFFLLLTAAMLHGWVEVLAVAAVSIAYLLWAHPVLSRGLTQVIVLLGPFAAITSLQRRTLLNKLSQFSEQVAQSRDETENARNSERSRIAADFHDGPLQSFISFQMRLEIVRKMLARDTQAGLDELMKLQELCRSQVSELRAFVRSMRPTEAGNASLSASIMRIVQTFHRESGILVSFTGGEGADLDEVEVNSDVLQVLREALHNAQKHSSASRILISAARKDGFLEFTVQDDGRGFPFSGTFTLAELNLLRLGPASIKHRVENLRGDLLLESKPGSGSRLEIRIPV